MSVVIETTIGDITVDLFTDERPVACLNFVKLCKLKYYNYNLFHTVEQGFIAQSGDPTGAGQGGSSVWGLVEGNQKRFFEAEYLPKIHHSSAGLLSLVSAGKNLVGSQFFFTLGSNLSSLDGIHCVIGEVVEGHEILRKLNESIVDDRFRPYQDVRITHTVILEDPYPDPRGFQVPSRSPSPTAERLQHGRIAADEDIDDTDGKSMQEIQEMLADREAKARATILEIVGDIPDAEMAPPENVLFVCKLNQVTTDDDLEIIFSRFGRVKCCEVIRDKKSGDSLQYAFVEFEEQKSCEAAYFKMDNVLIDDRRIHVDFSQSVAKIKWRGKGRGVDGPDGRLDFNNLKEGSVNGGDSTRRIRTRDEGERIERRRRQDSEERPPRDQRSRMTSAERRSAREARHREQEEQRSRQRSRSRNRDDRFSARTGNGGQRDDERRDQRQEKRLDRCRSPVERRDREDELRERRRDERRRNSRSRSREPRRRSREKRISPDRRRSDRRSSPADRRRQQDTSPLLPSRRNRSLEDQHKNEEPREKIKPNVQKDKLKRKKDSKKKKSKKSKRAASSESDTDSSTESSSESSSTDDDERRRRKKSKKSKKIKSKKPNKTHKSKK